MKCLHIIKKALAKEAGLIFYVSHKLCPKGHFSERWTAGGGCRDCRMERAIRDADKIKQRDLDYRARNIDALRAKSKKYYAENSEAFRKSVYAYQKANPEKMTTWRRTHYLKNIDALKEKHKAYYIKHPERFTAVRNRRRSAIRDAEGSHSGQEILDLFDLQRGMCATCKKKLKKSGKGIYHADHIQPISKGGSNWISNIQLLCPGCNLRKHDKDPLDWAKQNGKLL